MIDLLASIFCSATIFLLFKSFGQKRIDTFQAIVVNYLVAFSCGYALEPIPISIVENAADTWLLWAVSLGVLFIVLFNLIAMTTQRISVSVATISTKMSIIIPIVAAVPLYGDTMPALKVIGIILALAGVVLASWTNEKMKLGSIIFFLPLILFLGNGFIDLVLKYVQDQHLGNESPASFSGMIFLIAGLIGLITLIPRYFIYRKGFDLRSILAGVVLGIPNFGSIYFLMKALASTGLQSSEVFPINNIGIVLVSAFGAMLLFGEKGSKMNRIGAMLCVVAIAIIVFHEHLTI